MAFFWALELPWNGHPHHDFDTLSPGTLSEAAPCRHLILAWRLQFLSSRHMAKSSQNHKHSLVPPPLKYRDPALLCRRGLARFGLVNTPPTARPSLRCAAKARKSSVNVIAFLEDLRGSSPLVGGALPRSYLDQQDADC